MNHGRTVFAQLVELLPRKAFDLAVRRYDGQHRVRALSCMDQLLCMIFAQLTARASLRETVHCLRALGTRRYHWVIRGAVAKSTLADANERRDYRIFRDLALAMIATGRLELPVDRDLARLEADVLRLGLDDHRLVPEAVSLGGVPPPQGRRQGPYALRSERGNPCIHAGYPRQDARSVDARSDRPAGRGVLCAGPGVRRLCPPLSHAPGRGVLRDACQTRVWMFRVRERRPVPPEGPVRSDWLIRLGGPLSRGLYPDTLRRIRYVDPETGKRLVFLTNNLTLDPLTIALLYRKRWRIELFFKWIKQHLHITAFFGTTPNAVQSQLWIAVIVYVLVAQMQTAPSTAADAQRRAANSRRHAVAENPDKSGVFAGRRSGN